MRVTQPFDFAQGREPAKRQMDVFRQPHKKSKLLQWLQLSQDPADLVFSSMQILLFEQTPTNLLTAPSDASIWKSFHIPGTYTSPKLDLL